MESCGIQFKNGWKSDFKSNGPRYPPRKRPHAAATDRRHVLLLQASTATPEARVERRVEMRYLRPHTSAAAAPAVRQQEAC